LVAEHKKIDLDPTKLKELRWYPNGQAAFSGSLRKLYAQLDLLFLRLAATSAAEEMYFPVMLPAAELAKLEYFRSFPHLATFACALDPEPDNLQAFKDGPGLGDDGSVPLTKTAPVRDALTPAACYHFYINLQGEALDKPRYLTTRCHCFRREAYYAPLRRQWCFGMREIVCLGTADEVKAFLARHRSAVTQLQKMLNLGIEWTAATDPFFDPRSNPKYLAQRIDPVKTEMIFDGDLAIGSINFHRNFFGETFGITREDKPAFSGCVAFGIERWMWAILARYGTNPGDWPNLDQVRP
jgi:seryl-tRNA synthetase